MRYSVKICGRKTSIALERQFWDALDEIVQAGNITRPKFIRDAARESTSANLTSAVRLAILKHFQGVRGGPQELPLPSLN
jgi:predicted DNA-binding ribbon-helix-helix protein